jgi:hypothetical protein
MSAQQTGQFNFTRFTIPQIATQWGCKVHFTYTKHGGKVWLTSRVLSEVTCLRCRAAIAKATGSTA